MRFITIKIEKSRTLAGHNDVRISMADNGDTVEIHERTLAIKEVNGWIAKRITMLLRS